MWKKSKIILKLFMSMTIFSFACGGDEKETLPSPSPEVQDWVQRARIAGADLHRFMTFDETDAMLKTLADEHVNVVEVDTSFSDYMTEAEFDEELVYLKYVSKKCHDLGLKAVLYYPSLEVITYDAVGTDNPSMFRDHPEWIQKSLDGNPNVFYGDKEHWVDSSAESAWMSPNTGYRDYFLTRVKRIAKESGLDGIWVDVPIYIDTVHPWSGAGDEAILDFKKWANDNGYGSVEKPLAEDFEDRNFRLWVRWRHHNLAVFSDDIRLAGLQENKDFLTVIETFSVDYMDATLTGLDGSFRVSGDHLIRVWEIDSVSNVGGMEYATPEDFSSKIAMFKWGKAADKNNPTWSFSYGNNVEDARLVMAAAMATQNSPFETKTPIMTEGVDSDFRKSYFAFIKENEDALLGANRLARVGVLYSSASRDFHDYKNHGGYGMYPITTPPIDDDDWWSDDPDDSASKSAHLGGWRGTAWNLDQMGMPYHVIHAHDLLKSELEEIETLVLPSVNALSDATSTVIGQWVASGGVLIAMGDVPGQLNEIGDSRDASSLKDVFAFEGDQATEKRAVKHGAGLVYYIPDLKGREAFGSVGGQALATETLSRFEELIRAHTTEDVTVVDGPRQMHIEMAKMSDNTHYLFMTKFDGLQLPIVNAAVAITVDYHAPVGFRVSKIVAKTPDSNGQNGDIAFTQGDDRSARMVMTIDQFSVVEISLEIDN